MQDLPENHFGVSGASWVNISNYLIIIISVVKKIYNKKWN